MFDGATAFTFAGNLSAWDVRVVANMRGMIDSYEDLSASFCGFHWVTSGTAVVEFGLNTTETPGGLIPDIR